MSSATSSTTSFATTSSTPTSTYDIVISFDTTGSMSQCIREVRRQVKDTVLRLFKEIPESGLVL